MSLTNPYDELFRYIDTILPMTDEEKHTMANGFTLKCIPKNKILTAEGDIAQTLYFINKGLIRLYYTRNGEQLTGFIFKEGLFASSYDSFLRQVPSIQTLETLEDCELLMIRKTELEELYDSLPRMQVLARKIAEQRFINAQLMLSSFILDSPEERYKKFLEKNGDLLLRVPHYIIASLIGISPVSLSRIRKRTTG